MSGEAWALARRGSLREIADELGLSVPTVSRALGGYTDIAEGTRKRVAETAKRLGYAPNAAGRMLASGKSGFVGLVLPVGAQQFVDAYLGAIVAGLSEGFSERGLDLMIATVPATETPLDTIRKLIGSRRVDGLILARIAPQDPRIALLREAEVPFVALGRQLDGPGDHSWLDVDSGAAFAEAVERLAALGHRHIGLVSITDDFSFARHRDADTALAAARLGLRISRIAAPRADREARRQGIRDLLTAPDRPTAVLGLVDGIALDVLNIAADMGLSVPADLSVIGFDDIAGSGHSTPPLSTFEPYNQRLGRRAAHVLADLLTGTGKAPIQILEKAEFVTRGSHARAPDTK